MNCPECGGELKKGIVQARHAGSLLEALTMVTWYPEDERGKLLRRKAVTLRNDGEGYYCEACMKVFAALEER